MKAELKSAGTKCGELFATPCGTLPTPVCSVGSLDTLVVVRGCVNLWCAFKSSSDKMYSIVPVIFVAIFLFQEVLLLLIPVLMARELVLSI